MDGGNVELPKLSIQAPWRKYRGRGKSYPTSFVFVFWNWYLLSFQSYNQLVTDFWLVSSNKQYFDWPKNQTLSALQLGENANFQALNLL